LGGFEEGGEVGEFLDGLREVGGGDRGDVFESGGKGDGGGWKEGEAETEGWGREDGEGFDEDVGYGFRVEEVRVELVSVSEIRGSVSDV
jgi:hypothetical protein